MALTDTAIRGTKSGMKPFKMYDREGLFLLVNPSGSKLWRWRYRFEGKEKLMALGEYPFVGLAQAREIHLAARELLVKGVHKNIRVNDSDFRRFDAGVLQQIAQPPR